MEINPQGVRNAEFKTVRKGADPGEVSAFLNDVADELERAQNQSTAMEARARAAVARLQELNEASSNAPAASVEPSVEESETISRTLVLAQRTADQTVNAARAEAEQILRKANDEAARTLDSTREMSAQLLEEARVDARKIGESERLSVSGEVEALRARRDFLESDVHHLEAFLVEQRARVREAATSLLDIAERVPGGLGEVRAPLLSASDDASDDEVEAIDDAEEPAERVIATELTADDEDDAAVEASTFTQAEADHGGDLDVESWADDSTSGGDETKVIEAFALDKDDESEPTSPRDISGEDFRFSFDDERH